MHMVVILNSLIEILYIASNPGQDSKTALLLNIFSIFHYIYLKQNSIFQKIIDLSQ